METGIGALYSTFVCLLVGMVSLAVFYSLRKKRKKKQLEYSVALDYFSLLLGLLWATIGIGTFLAWLGNPQYHTFLYKWIIGPLTYLHLLPALYYLTWSLFDKRRAVKKALNGLFTILALVALVSHFAFGFDRVGVTYWGTKHKINSTTQAIFTFGLFIPGFSFIAWEAIRRFRKMKESGSFKQKQLFGLSLGLLAYTIAGLFETMVFNHGWLILLGRVGIMIGPLIFYFFATLEGDKET
ncbi:MAG: hypothetical protein GF370_01110 [Candidatus Nealsonbacteria bacterium]|nr:hypothetical protein [Candidatus Nealsonbacteria bacterium]